MKSIEEIMKDPQAVEAILKIGTQTESVMFEMKDGTMGAVEVWVYEVGRLLVALEKARIILGHTTINSTLRYVHGIDSQEFIFLRDIIKNEKQRLRKEEA